MRSRNGGFIQLASLLSVFAITPVMAQIQEGDQVQSALNAVYTKIQGLQGR